MLVGHQKGRDLKERTNRNFGMAYPEGYRKAMRAMALADRHGFPLVTMVDTPGAYPGVAAEQHGQGGAIARSQAAMVRLNVPTVACVIGEGGSGGAVAIAVADRVLMQENAIYSVISPEGCAAILWRDAGEARKAAAAFKPDAAHCLELGVVDAIVAEPEGGAHARSRRGRAAPRAGHSRCTRGDRDPRSGRAPAPAAREVPRDGRSGAPPSRSGGFPHLPQAYPRSRKRSEQGKEASCSLLVKKPLRFGRQSTGEPRPVPPKAQSGKTPEPFGEPGERAIEQPRFVVQRHAARRLHYDFRLERDGALASWAVPKGVPLRRGERHLAVHVEDHPLDYADFEGTIPAGEYGAGTVEIWDKGTYELLEEKRDGGLTVELHGERLDGVWTLVPAALDGDPKNWLLLRKDAGDGSGDARTSRCSRRPRTRSRRARAGSTSRSGTAFARSSPSRAAT